MRQKHRFYLICCLNIIQIHLSDMKDIEEASNFVLLPVPIQEVPSEFTPQYLQFYGLSREKFDELKQGTLEEAQKTVIVDCQRDFRNKVLIKMVSCSKGYEFIHLQVTLGYFIFPRIDVFNRKANSQTHSLFFSRAGNFGRVYRAHCFYQEIAIKCFSYKPNNFKRVLSEALSEYCFLKLASFLRAGPRLPSKTGYELIIYEDCIEFAMEYCEQLNFSTLDSRQGQQLKESLLKLHQLNAMHLDIKPDNIRYSTSYQKQVFIDFGFTKFIKQYLGFKTRTYFKGTATYCSQEMDRLCEQRKQGYVDLYFNDIKGLSNILSNDNKQKKQVQEDFMQQKEKRRTKFSVIEDITVHHMKYSIKYLLSQGAQSAAKDIFEEYKRVHLGRKQNELCKKAPLVTYECTLGQINDQRLQESDAQFIESVLNCISSINQLSSSGKIDVWNENKDYQTKVINNDQGQAQKDKQSYYRILSRVLKINSTKYTFQEKNILAKTAVKALGITQAEIFQGRQWKSCPEIGHLSKLLLDFSLEANTQQRAPIFINVMFNIFALEILDFDEAVDCFQQITRERHGKAIEMMTAFYKGFCIIFYLTDRFDDFKNCQVVIQKIAKNFIEQLPQGAFKQVLFIIFSIKSAEKTTEIPKNSFEKYKDKIIYEELQDFAAHKLALGSFQSLFEEKQQYERRLDKILKKTIQNSLKHISFQFQHFHFLWILKCYAEDKHQQCLKICKHFSDVFQEKCIRFIKMQLIDMTFSLQQTPTKTIQEFSQLLLMLKSKRYNQVIQKNIKFLIRRIIFVKYYIFIKMDEKRQSTILQYYAPLKVNIRNDQLHKSMFKMLTNIRKTIKLKERLFLFYQKYFIKQELGQKVDSAYNCLKRYYDQLRQYLTIQDDTFLVSLLVALIFLHILKQNFAVAKQLCVTLCPVIAKMKNLIYLHYQYLFYLFQKFSQNFECKQSIYINYIDRIDSNKQYDYLFKRTKTLSFVLQYFYENSSKKLPIFINKIARYLSIYNQKIFVNNYIKVFLVSLTYKSTKSLKIRQSLKSASLDCIDKIEPMSHNPYNSLFFFHMISLDFLKAEKNIFVRIFKAFPFIKTNAQEYICRTIYEKYLDMFYKELPKRKAKKILFKAMINQPNLLKCNDFMKLFKLNNHKAVNSPLKSLQKHLNIFYDNQIHRVHYQSAIQKKIAEKRKSNFKAATSQIYMRHIKALEEQS